MAQTTGSLNKRTLSPVVGSAVVGLALGVVAVIGVSQFSSSSTIPESGAVPADSAVLGGPEYGSRN
ncbi:hypothetical protein CPHO_11330 [Corynebacterium phocae]|uniref:DUF2613 domain-containing protein n=1 Tax=Corynebacterium phocae TaxID=161895 RepID=A0A1L7D5M8_9CORY|nr:DUF2613 domain-containing protein [Corynebacterium phocae]APT93377.1 hypothetical protein CPHO_11330 [Corynebacterium phocae]KAA8721719.1 DUF2613 family protein [Corynebacterium phocae]